MLKVEHDESLQSFILRVLMVSGKTNVDTLTRNKDMWRSVPHVKSSDIRFFDAFDTKSLFSLIQNSTLELPPIEMFDDPTMHQRALKGVFRSGDGSNLDGYGQKALPINFCSSCLKRDLQVMGVGYFRSQWLYSNRCGTCNSEMKTLKKVGNQPLFDSLCAVLAGDFTIKSERARKKDYAKKAPTLASRKHFIEPMAPCVRKMLLNLTNSFANRVTFRATKAVRPPFKQQTISSGLLEVSDENLEKLLTDKFPPALRQFDRILERDTEVIQIPVFEKADEVFVAYRVMKYRNCKHCMLKREGYKCKLFPDIIATYSTNNVPDSHLSMCDYYLRHRTHQWESKASSSESINQQILNVFKS